MGIKVSYKDFNNEVLMLFAKEKNDELFSSFVKKIIKTRYETMNLNITKLGRILYKKKYLEAMAISEIIIDKSKEEEGFLSYDVMEKIIDNLDFNYLMTTNLTSKNNLLRELAYKKIDMIFAEIENIKEVKEELEKKMEEDNKVKRRMLNDKY